MATKLKKLEGDDIPTEYRHLDQVFRVESQSGQVQYFENDVDAAQATAEEMVEDRAKNG